MINLIVRPAKENDIKLIANMIYKWIRWHRERDPTIQEVLRDKNHEILVSELNGEVVGVLHQIFYLDILLGGYNCHIIFLLVDEKYRGKGIGTKLLKVAIENAKKRGAIEVHVDTIFEKAKKFYRKLGFKDDGIYLELVLSHENC